DFGFVADVETALGDVLRLRKKYPEAEAVLQRALSRYSPDADPASVATTYNNLALVYKYQNRFAEAEQAYLKSLALQEKTSGQHSPEVLTVLGNLASTYVDQGQVAAAIDVLRRALEIEKANGQALPLIHYTYARALEKLARLDDALQEYAKALGLAER